MGWRGSKVKGQGGRDGEEDRCRAREGKGGRLIDNRPTKSLGLILGLMHQIKIKINIKV